LPALLTLRGPADLAKTDFYEVLGLQKGADEGALKSAYRKLAMQFHPDRNPGDKTAEHKFKEISEAYDTLKDPQKRAAYDRFGHAAFENGAGRGPGPGFGPDFGASMSDIFEDLFGDMMGGGRGGGAPGGASARLRGSDLRYNLEIALPEAFSGKTAQVRIPTTIGCETCSGTGAKAGTKPKACATCGGAGKVRANQGFFTIERTFPACTGRGEGIAAQAAATVLLTVALYLLTIAVVTRLAPRPRPAGQRAGTAAKVCQAQSAPCRSGLGDFSAAAHRHHHHQCPGRPGAQG